MRLIPVYTWSKSTITFNARALQMSKQPWFQGMLLLACVIVAMLLANLPFTKELYHNILDCSVGIKMDSPDGSFSKFFPREMTIEKFINDILMVIFFFTVGLEIKREINGGELSTPKKAILPVIAAFGGVLFPALIYTFVNHGTPASSGWGIPTATDIAFAVCILSVLGDKVPVAMKVFLTALAIADDLIAILVVAFFYGGQLNFVLIGIAVVVIIAAFMVQKAGVMSSWPYLLFALAIWILFYYGGIHSTMAGVVMAFVIPSKPKYNKSYFMHKWRQYYSKMEEFEGIANSSAYLNGPQRHYMREINRLSSGSVDMSHKLETILSPWVNFLIMPLFALANAGVEINGEALATCFTYNEFMGSVGLGIALGLVIGKPLGITLLSFITIKLGIGEMPAKTNWPMFFAVACLGGIGFTMSIFVDTLSFGGIDPAATELLRGCGKIAVLAGSSGAAVLGSLLVNFVCKLHSLRK